MKVLKIMAEGDATAFRLPRDLIGKHFTYEMPPPSTIYGHVCSAVGRLIDPYRTQFAYYFDYETKFWDFNKMQFPGASKKTSRVQPVLVEQLYQPRLTLYLSDTSLLQSFMSPKFSVGLGRSQDLMTYTDIRIVELQKAEQAFYAGTLVNLEFAAQLGGANYAVSMSRFIDDQRIPTFYPYSIVREAVIFPSENSIQFDNHIEIWVDPEPDASHPYLDIQRGVVWHDWQ